MKVAIALSLAIIFAAAGDVNLSRGMRSGGEVAIHGIRDIPGLIKRIISNPFVLIGVLCMAVHIASYAASLAWVDVSVANPLTALSYVIATGYVALIARERVMPGRWIGVMLITIGAVMVGMSS